LNITSLLQVVLFDYTTLLISYTHNGDDTHKDLRNFIFCSILEWCKYYCNNWGRWANCDQWPTL